MKLQITHETRYDYAPAVNVAQHMAYLQPCTTRHQTLIEHRIDINPAPAQHIIQLDVFGNTRQFFSLQTAHTQLKVVSNSIVQTIADVAPASHITWEQVRDRFDYHALQPYDPAIEFTFASPHIPRMVEFARYAQPSLGQGIPFIQAAHHLMQRIHADFEYESHSTEISTPALEALSQRKGVCQDFAHIMIASLRANGLPARYVSGYLLTHPAPGQQRLLGSDASHAWCSVYLPDWQQGARWYDLDPTNNRAGWGSPGEDYVTLAVGRDYADVSPIRGVIHGGGHHTLQVAVTVEPLEESLCNPASLSA